jgi:diguanylate cyclase (GGDEF)-like protein/PAS domain S-box-containing protein
MKTSHEDQLDKTAARHTQHDQAERELLDSATEQACSCWAPHNTLYHAIFEKNQAVKLVIDPESGAIVDANPAACAFYGYPHNVLCTLNIRQINMLPAEQVQTRMRAARHEQQLSFRFRHRLASGELRDVDVYSGPVEVDGRTLLLSIIFDVTDQVRAEAALRQAHAQLAQWATTRATVCSAPQPIVPHSAATQQPNGIDQHIARLALDQTADPVVWLDSEGRYLYVNDATCQRTGYTREELLGRTIWEIDRNVTPADWTSLQNYIKQHGATSHEANIHHKDGSPIPVEITSNYIEYDGHGYVCSFLRDISEHHATRQQIQHQALHDRLTGLPNRTLFLELLEHSVQRARRSPDYRFAVLFLDLDNFKIVNDSLGHHEGDKLLVNIAQRLRESIRASDMLARFGGDEFVILLDDLDDYAEVDTLAQRIQQVLGPPFTINDHPITVSISIGVALGSDPLSQPADLLRDADTAMYRAKALGPGHYVIFDPTMHLSAVERLHTENELRRAIEHDELRVYYQPIVTLATGQITGFEALVRWQHPRRGLLLPGDFIPVAEETGLIVPLGWWVLRIACQQMAAWQQRYPRLQPLSVAVNLAGQSFLRSDVTEQIAAVLDETGLDPISLKLEITESMLMNHTPDTIMRLQQLRDMGIQLSLDDFGTGYSSLRYLHRFPIHILKIDRSFVSRLHIDEESTAITQMIVTLGRTLGKAIVAEGIETDLHLRYVQNLGCHYAQGFFFSRAVTSDTAETWLAAETHQRRGTWYGQMYRNQSRSC